MKKRTKMLLIIGAVVIVVAIAGYFGARLFIFKSENKPQKQESSATQDETANWKTYKTEYGFEFKYPEDVEVIKNKPIDEEGIPDGNYLDSFITGYSVVIDVRKTTEPDIRSWFRKQYPKDEEMLSSFEDLSVNDLKAVKYKSKILGDDSYYIQVDGKILSFSFMDFSDEEAIEYNKNIFNIVKNVKQTK